MSVVRSASAEGRSPSRSRRARMKWSIGLRGQAALLDVRQRRPRRRARTPSVRTRRALLDPLAEERDLLRRQLLAGLGRRHPLLGVRGRDALDHGALGGLAGHDGGRRRSAACRRRLPWCRAAAWPCAGFSSGPWQAKQFSDRMGRMWRLKSTRMADFVAGGAAMLAPQGPRPSKPTPTRPRIESQRRLEFPTIMARPPGCKVRRWESTAHCGGLPWQARASEALLPSFYPPARGLTSATLLLTARRGLLIVPRDEYKDMVRRGRGRPGCVAG